MKQILNFSVIIIFCTNIMFAQDSLRFDFEKGIRFRHFKDQVITRKSNKSSKIDTTYSCDYDSLGRIEAERYTLIFSRPHNCMIFYKRNKQGQVINKITYYGHRDSLQTRISKVSLMRYQYDNRKLISREEIIGLKPYKKDSNYNQVFGIQDTTDEKISIVPSYSSYDKKRGLSYSEDWNFHLEASNQYKYENESLVEIITDFNSDIKIFYNINYNTSNQIISTTYCEKSTNKPDHCNIYFEESYNYSKHKISTSKLVYGSKIQTDSIFNKKSRLIKVIRSQSPENNTSQSSSIPIIESKRYYYDRFGRIKKRMEIDPFNIKRFYKYNYRKE